jgi:hypothetical protein
MAIYSELSHEKWWCPIVMLVYQRVTALATSSTSTNQIFSQCQNGVPVGVSDGVSWYRLVQRGRNPWLPKSAIRCNLSCQVPWRIGRFGRFWCEKTQTNLRFCMFLKWAPQHVFRNLTCLLIIYLCILAVDHQISCWPSFGQSSAPWSLQISRVMLVQYPCGEISILARVPWSPWSWPESTFPDLLHLFLGRRMSTPDE